MVNFKRYKHYCNIYKQFMHHKLKGQQMNESKLNQYSFDFCLLTRCSFLIPQQPLHYITIFSPGDGIHMFIFFTIYITLPLSHSPLNTFHLQPHASLITYTTFFLSFSNHTPFSIVDFSVSVLD